MQKYINTSILMLTSLIRPFGFMLALTALPDLSKQFHTTEGIIIQSTSTYAIGIGVFSILYGFLSDKLGRKRIFLLGFLLFGFSNYICIYSQSVYQYIIATTLQGCSFGFSESLLYASLKDLYEEGRSLGIVITISEILFGITSALSPYLGGMIYEKYSWQAIYVFVTIISVLLFIIILFCFKETNITYKNKSSIKYINLFSKKFILFTILSLLGCASVSIYVTDMPFINSSTYSLNSIKSGIVLMILGFMYLSGSIINLSLLLKYKIEKIIFYSILTFLIFSVVSILSIFFLDYYLIFIPLILMLVSSGIIFPDAATCTMQQSKGYEGISGGFICSSMWIGGALITVILGMMPMINISVVIASLIVGVSMLLIWRYSDDKQKI